MNPLADVYELPPGVWANWGELPGLVKISVLRRTMVRQPKKVGEVTAQPEGR